MNVNLARMSLLLGIAATCWVGITPSQGASHPSLPASSVPAITALSGAPTVYVDSSAPSGGNGSATAPFQTLQSALSQLQSTGGTIQLNGGTYYGPVSISTRYPLHIVGKPGTNPVLSCSQRLTNWTRTSTSSFIYAAHTPLPVAQVFVNGSLLQRARYPQTGFLSVGADSPTHTSPSQNTTIIANPNDGSTLASKDLVNAVVTLKAIDYWYNTSVVGSFVAASNTINLSTSPAMASECSPQCNLTYNSKAGWGYFLENKPWMMTYAGSWAFDPATRMLYVWMPSNADPTASTSSVEVATDQDCVTVSNTPNLAVQNLTIKNSGKNGVTLSNSPSSRWNHVTIQNTKRYGLRSSASDPLIVDESSFLEIGSNAILGNFADTPPANTSTIIESNWFYDIGTAVGPQFVSASIYYASKYATTSRIANNWLTRSSYIGIYSGAGSLVTGNTVENFCLNTDDGAGLYTNGSSAPGTVFSRNIVRNGTANVAGKPASRSPYPVAGIYLDDFASGVTVTNNFVTSVDIGFNLHNAHDTVFQYNKVSNASRYAVSLQEDSIRKHFDLSTNLWVTDQNNGSTFPSMANNQFIKNGFINNTKTGETIHHSSNQANTLSRLQGAYLGSYNNYYNVFDEVVVNSSSGKFTYYDLKPSGLDSNPYRPAAGPFPKYKATQLQPQVYAATATDITHAFSSYTKGTTGLRLGAIPCPIAGSRTGACLSFTAATDSTSSTLISPLFSISQGQFYKATLQITAGDAMSPMPLVNPLPIRNGPTYEAVDSLNPGSVFTQAPTNAWKTFEWYFQASETVSNARMNLNVGAGRTIIVGDFTVTPVSAEAVNPMDHYVEAVNVDYNNALTNYTPPGLNTTTGWYNFGAAQVSFPLATLPPRGFEVYWHY